MKPDSVKPDSVKMFPALRLLHWVALDAVLVLLAYQWALSRWMGADLPSEAWGFLAAGIWLGYTADRALDLARHPSLAEGSPRHAFLRRHGTLFAASWVLVLGGAAFLAPARLAPGHLAVGLALGVLAALYVGVATGWIGWGDGGGIERGGTEGTGANEGGEGPDTGSVRPPPRPAFRRVLTAGLLALAGGWWFLPDPAGLWPRGVDLMVVFALAAWVNLTVLQRPQHPTPERRDRLALLADGTLAVAMIGLGILAT